MSLRRSLHACLICICLILVAFAVVMAVAINRLQKQTTIAINQLEVENKDLKLGITTEIKELTRQLEEHRGEERDRYFQSLQEAKLEGIRTREAVKDASP